MPQAIENGMEMESTKSNNTRLTLCMQKKKKSKSVDNILFGAYKRITSIPTPIANFHDENPKKKTRT